MAEGDPVQLSEVRQQPIQAVVDEMREWLELAKRGELRSVVIVGMIREPSGEDTFRYNHKGDATDMMAASMAEQFVFSARLGIQGTESEVPDVEVSEDEDADPPT